MKQNILADVLFHKDRHSVLSLLECSGWRPKHRRLTTVNDKGWKSDLKLHSVKLNPNRRFDVQVVPKVVRMDTKKFLKPFRGSLGQKSIFYVLSTSLASVSKRYYIDNVPNHYKPHFEPLFFDSYSGKNTAKVDGVGKITTTLLHDIYIRAGKGFNIALSPVSIWVILAMLLEGAGGKTENELKTKLQLSYNTPQEGRQILRNQYKELLNLNKGGNGPTELTTLSFVISRSAEHINPDYKNIIRQYYNGQHFETDGTNGEQFARMINTWASQVTRNRISNLISPAVLNNLLLVIGNAVYFKSQWKYPFDPSQTILMPFKDENERPIRNVPMMNQVAVLPYTYNVRLESEIVELPYADGVTSMIVILPREKVSLKSVLARMKDLSIGEIAPKNLTEETIQLIMPRFHINSKMYLNEILKPDLRTVFSPQNAEFPYIGKNIFVSKIAHKAEIENTEEGTTASAITTAQFAYKSSSINFRANRPFIYLINEIKTRTVLFAGTYSNPFAA